jgi:hypothetical protein
MSLFRHRTSQPLWLATIYRADCAGTFASATWNIDLRAACTQPRDDRQWVKSFVLAAGRLLLVCPDKQTSSEAAGMSQTCQQQKWPRSFDQLIGARDQHRWNAEVERLGRFQIDDQRNFRGLLHRQLTRRSAIQDPFHVR